MKNISILLFSLLFLISCQSQSVDLSFQLEKGKEYKHTSSTQSTISQDIEGQKFDMVMTVGGTMTFLVKDITTDGYEMDVKFEELNMLMELPQATIDVSSEKNDPNDILSAIFAAMKGNTFQMSMSKTGKITDLTGVDALWDSVIAQFDNLNELQKTQILQQISDAYGEDALKGNIEMSTAIYPENPVNKGDNWTINTSLQSGMSAEMTTKYEYVESTPDYAVIKGLSTIVTDDNDAYFSSNGMDMRYDIEGTMESEIKIDIKTGWIIEATTLQEIKGDTYIKSNPQLPEGMKIPITITNKTKVKN